jgi:hypothetical protein
VTGKLKEKIRKSRFKIRNITKISVILAMNNSNKILGKILKPLRKQTTTAKGNKSKTGSKVKKLKMTSMCPLS